MTVRSFATRLFLIFAFLTAVLPMKSLAAVASSQATVSYANSRLATLATSSVSAAETRALLVARKNAMEEILAQAPATARSYMLSAATEEALLKADPSYGALIEKDVPLTGQFSAVVGDDFAGGTASTIYYLHTTTGDRAVSFATAPVNPDSMVHQQVTVTGLSLSDVVAVESIRPATSAEIAACVVPTASSSEPSARVATPDLNSHAVAANAATASCTVLGTQTTAVITLQFTGGTATYPTTPVDLSKGSSWAPAFSGPTPSVNDFMTSTSNNQTSLNVDYYGPITLPQVYDCTTTTQMATAAVTAAIAAGVDFSKYNRVVWVYPVNTCVFAGLNDLGCVAATTQITHQYSTMWLPVLPTTTIDQFYWKVPAHELGHGFGLGHSNTLDFGTAGPLGPFDFTASNPGRVAGAAETGIGVAKVINSNANTAVTAVNTEYGDNYAVMGPGGSVPYNGYFSTQQQVSLLGWIPASTSAKTLTNSGGVFNLLPTEQFTGLRALQLLRDSASGSWVWVEYHQSVGTYTPLGLLTAPTGFNLTQGVQLRYQNGFDDPTKTFLMNMGSQSPVPNNFAISDLLPGSSWSDPYSLLTVSAGTPTGTGASSQIPVTVSYDTPCAMVAVSPTTLLTAGGQGTVSITAPGTCAWSVSSNASWITATGSTSGTGSGTVTFNYAANTGAQRNSYITAARQSVAVVQPGTGITVVSASPSGVTAAPGAMTTYTFTLQNAVGIPDLLQVNVNFGSRCTALFQQATNGSTWFLALNGVTGNQMFGGTGTVTNGTCTLDGPSATFAVNGNSITFSVGVTFAAATSVASTISVQGYSKTLLWGTSIPVGYFIIATPAAASLSISPTIGNANSTVPITLTGANTAFTAATTVTVSGTGVTASTPVVVNGTSLTTNLSIAANASTTTPYTISVSTGTQVLTGVFTVNPAPTPTLSMSPNVVAAGQILNATLTGVNTNFVQGTTQVSVSGAGNVSVNSVTVVSPTSITATFGTFTSLPTGAYTVTVTTGSQVVTTTLTLAPAATPEITLSTLTAAQGTASVPETITFVLGNILNPAVTPTVTITGPSTAVTASSVALVSANPNPGTITASFNVPFTATAGAYTVSVTGSYLPFPGNTPTPFTATAPFTVTQVPAANVSASPNSGTANGNYLVTFTGNNTTFNSSSAISLSGSGITVSSVNVLSPTSMTANFAVSSTAPTGLQTVTITTPNGQTVTTPFTVSTLTPTTTTVVPSSGSVAQGTPVSLNASVSASAGTPTGLVTFTDNAVSDQPITLGSVNLSGGKASLSVSTLALGQHSISVQYAGDGTTFDVSTSTTPALVTVTPGTPSATLSTVQVSSAASTAGTAVQVTVTLKDAFGNAVSNVPVSLASLPGGTVTAISSTSSSLGVATFSLNDKVAETDTVTATAAATSGTVILSSQPQVTFSPGAPSAAVSKVSAGVSSQGVNGAAGVTVTVLDQYGNAVPNVLVALAPSSTTAVVTATQATTTAAGIATFSVTDSKAGLDTFAASVGGSMLSSVSVSFLDFSFATSGATSVTVIPGQSASFGVSVSPSYNNLYPGAVSFALSGLPTGATYSVSPTSIATTGGAQTVTITITAPAVVVASRRLGRNGGWVLALLLPLMAMRRQRRRLGSILTLLVLSAVAVSVTGCSTSTSTGFFGQNPQNYAVTVTATSGSVQHSSTINVQVQ